MSGGRVPPVATLLVLESRPPPRGGEATFERRGRAGFVHSLLCKVLDGGGVWAAGLWNHGQRTGGRTVALKAWLQGNTVCHAGLATCLGRQPLVLRPPPPEDETASCFGQFGCPTIEANQRSPLCMQPCRATRRGRRGRWAPTRALVRSSSTRAQLVLWRGLARCGPPQGAGRVQYVALPAPLERMVEAQRRVRAGLVGRARPTGTDVLD